MNVKVGKSLPWLVKSGGRILGPFEAKEVAEKLKNREFVVLDEVSQPLQRWVYIRDEKTFIKVVEEMRSKNSRMNDETTTDTDQTKTSTPTPSITQSVSGVNDDLTDDLNRVSAQDAVFKSFDEVGKSSRERKAKSDEYMYSKDPIVQTKARDAARWLWVLSAGLIFITLAYVMFAQFIAKPIQNEIKAEDRIIKGNEALEDGQYQLALKNLEEAYEYKPDEESIWLHLGLLKIQYVNQNVEGRRILEKLSRGISKDSKRLYTALGLAFLRGNDLKESEAFFTKVLDIDPSFTPALVNIGVVAMYQNNFSKAASQFQLALKDGSSDGAEILMLVEALLYSYQRNKDVTYLEEAKKYIDQYLVAATDYLSEVYVAKMHVLSALGQTAEIYQIIDAFIDLDPLQTQQHKHNLFIFRDRISWKLINQWCLKATEKLDPSSHVVAAEALCLFKAGELVDANKKIENAIAQTPKDPIVQAVYAHLLEEMGSFEKSKVSIDRALASDVDKKYQLPRILQARFCVKVDDQICAANFWTELIKINQKSLAGIAGSARSQYLANRPSEARKYILRGLDLSANYIPFLEIQRLMTKTPARSKAQ